MDALLYAFLIFTPVLILASWLLEIAVDTPAKNFANKVDIASRIEQKPRVAKDGEKLDEDDNTWYMFCLKSWELWALFAWFSVILIATEVYGAIDGNGERIMAEAKLPEMLRNGTIVGGGM